LKILLVEVVRSMKDTCALGVGYLYSVLEKAGHKVDLEILHDRSHIDDLIKKIKEKEYPLIGFSATFYTVLDSAISAIVKIKERGIKSCIVMGGHPVTFCYERIMEYFPVDCIVMGEGEVTLLELADRFYDREKWDEIGGLVFAREGRLMVNGSRELIPDLDSLPYPHRERYGDNKGPLYHMMITTSRGCYGRCSFCSIYNFYNHNVRRGRSVKNVVGEIEELVERYGTRIMDFVDDNFFSPHDRDYKWYYDFADEIEKRGLEIIFGFQCRPNDVNLNLFKRLKEVGLFYVFVGFESFIPRSLKLFNKSMTLETSFKALEILKDLDMYYRAGLIVFEPFSTFDEVKYNFQVIKSLYDKFNYSVPLSIDRLNIHYSTPIYEILKEKNLLEGEFPYYSYTIEDKRVETLYGIIFDSIKHTVKNTEKDILFAPYYPLGFLLGISILAGLPPVKKGSFPYLPEEKVRDLSIQSSRFFLDLIYKAIDLLDREEFPSTEEVEEVREYCKEEYFKETYRLGEIADKETIRP